MEDIWIFSFLSWVFFGPIGLVNFFIFLAFCGVIYFAYVAVASFFLQKPWKEVHSDSLEVLSGFYAQTVVGEALKSVWDAIAFSISQLLRALVLPIKLLSGWIINLLMGPVDNVLNKGEDILDEVHERDARRQAVREENASKRYVKREIQKAKIRKIKIEAKRAKAELRLPNFSENDFGKTDSEIANEIIMNGHADHCQKALKSGELDNPSIKSVSAFLHCSQAHARTVRNELHRRGVLMKHQSGQMSYVSEPDKSND